MINEKTVNREVNGNAALSSNKERIHKISRIAILSATAFILMYLEFSLPLMPVFLKFDFSEIPVLLAAFSIGPWAGVIVEFIKNLLHLPFTHTAMTGELANFIVGSAFVLTASYIYHRNKTHKNAIIGMLCGTLAMALAGCLVNYYMNIPFYINAMGLKLEDIIAATNAVGNTMVKDLRSLILWVFLPFNLFKGLVISLAVNYLYKPLSPLLKIS